MNGIHSKRISGPNVGYEPLMTYAARCLNVRYAVSILRNAPPKLVRLAEEVEKTASQSGLVFAGGQLSSFHSLWKFIIFAHMDLLGTHKYVRY